MKLADVLKQARGQTELLRLLDHAADDEIFAIRELRAHGFRKDALQRLAVGGEMSGYWVLISGIRYWGNKKAIAKAKARP